ncbi:hypothetical protein PybrP1_010518 [[Pythium] brassicae (nom. inval.)]|nr:hypothetical protein PybrP1_010518 [[Pythium] brassicae (nom. inval.)]
MGSTCSSSVQVLHSRRVPTRTAAQVAPSPVPTEDLGASNDVGAHDSERLNIRVTNVLENEVVTHSLVLLEGCVDNFSLVKRGVSAGAIEYVQASTSLIDSPDPEFSSSTRSSTSRGLCWPVVASTGRFKAFVLLPKPGAYEIRLQVASASLLLHICFAPPRARCVVRFHYQKPWDSNQGFDAPPGIDNTDNAAIDRLKLGALLLQTVFAELLHRAGGARRTFALELGDNGLPVVHLLRSQFSTTHARVMDDADLLVHLRQDVLSTEARLIGWRRSVGSDEEHVLIKHVVVLGGAHFDAKAGEVYGHKELVDGNVVVFGSCGLHTWPRALSELTASCLDASRFQQHHTFPRGCVTSSRGGGWCWSTFACSFSRLMQLVGSSFGLEYQRDGVMRADMRTLSRMFSVFEPATQTPTFSRPIGDGRFGFVDTGALSVVSSRIERSREGDDEGAGDGLWLDAASIDTLTSNGATAAVVAVPVVRVEIVNLRPNERLAYPLVLIEGHVAFVDVNADAQPIENITAVVRGAATPAALSWPVVPGTGHFKAFALLPQPGKHTVELRVGGALVHELVVRYARPNTKHFARFHYQKQTDETRGFDAPPGVDNSDGAALARIRLGALLTQTCIAELFHRQGLPRATIAIEFEEVDGCERPRASLLLTPEFQATEPVSVIRQALDEQDAAAWESEGVSLTHFVHVGSNHYDRETHRVPDHCAHMFGGLFAFSSVTLHTWPSALSELTRCCLDTTEIDTSQLSDDSAGRGSHWANFSTGLGVFMHLFFRSFTDELTCEGMLGRGFDNSNRLLSVYEPEFESASAVVAGAISEEGEPERLVLNRSVLEAVGDNLEGAYMEEAALLVLLQSCPILTSASKFSQEPKNAAGAA